MLYVYYRFISCHKNDIVLDVAELLRNHTSAIFFTKSVVFIIRRSRPWKSFIREMTQQNVDDTMDFEVFIVCISRCYYNSKYSCGTVFGQLVHR